MEQNNNSKLWKSIYLVILTLVTIGCMMYGIFRQTKAFRHWFSDNDDYAASNQMMLASTEAFNEIRLNISVGDLKIEYGDDYNVTHNYSEKLSPDVSVRNGVLTINQNVGSLNFGGLNDFKDMNYNLVITLPKDTTLGNVSLEMDMGNIVLNDIKAGNLTIDADMGNIELYNVSFEKMDFDADMGSIEMNNVTFTNGECDADMGSIEFSNVSFDKLTCDADMGSIDIEGLFNKLNAKCSMGSIDVNTEQDLEKISLDLSTDLGKVTINGREYGKEYIGK